MEKPKTKRQALAEARKAVAGLNTRALKIMEEIADRRNTLRDLMVSLSETLHTLQEGQSLIRTGLHEIHNGLDKMSEML